MQYERDSLAEALWPHGGAYARPIACRHCEARNRVALADAALSPARCSCGSCHGPLFLGPDEPLEGLRPSHYEHSLDRKALDAARSVPGFQRALNWIVSHATDRVLRLSFEADNLRCGSGQFPELVALARTAERRLALDLEPTLYLGQSPFLNAGATGTGERFIVVRSGLLDVLDDSELSFVLGHELGHLSSEHVQMHLAAALVIAGAHMVLPSFVSLPLTRALLLWYRRGELTCDRAGLLGCRDLGASLTALAKLCGGNGPGTRSRTTLRLEPFVRQAREMALAQEGDKVNDLLSTLLVLNRTHPFVVARAMHLIDWVEHGSYLELLAGGAAR